MDDAAIISIPLTTRCVVVRMSVSGGGGGIFKSGRFGRRLPTYPAEKVQLERSHARSLMCQSGYSKSQLEVILSIGGKRREASLACISSGRCGGDVVEAAAATASTFLRPASPPPFKSQDGEIGIKLPHVAGKGELLIQRYRQLPRFPSPPRGSKQAVPKSTYTTDT